MKQIFTILAALLVTTNLWAQSFQYDGLYYNITSSYEPYTVEVTYQEVCSPSNYSDLTSVTIPETVTYEGTTYSVTSIGDVAFAYCSALTYVTIPNSVTSIGYDAFYGCSSLTSITIPNNVTSIGYRAFGGCSSLASMIVESGNSTYDSRENCNAIIETATNTLIAGCKNTIIPNSVTSIGGGTFEGCTNLTSVTIPNSVTSIGYGAFSDCSALTSITIPNNVTSIGERAFYGCSALTSITIPNSVTSIGDEAFAWCSSLTSVTIPNSVTSIGNYTFDGCDALTSVTIPNSVTSIGNYAFSDCESLTSITIPNSVTSIGEGAFNRCRSLTSITIPNSVTSIVDYAFNSCSSLTSITIPNSVTSIGGGAFWGCSLTSITIPNNVTSIGEGAFYWCDALTSIVVESGNSTYDSRENCNAIIETATNTLIAGCKNTIIPNSVTSIGDAAFSWCSSIKTVICEAIEVPELLGYDVFYDMPLSEATLYVPAQSLDDYKAAEQWKEFGTILPIEETSTGVENTYNPSSIADTNKLIRDGQLIIVRGGKSYSVTGQELY